MSNSSDSDDTASDVGSDISCIEELDALVLEDIEEELHWTTEKPRVIGRRRACDVYRVKSGLTSSSKDVCSACRIPVCRHHFTIKCVSCNGEDSYDE